MESISESNLSGCRLMGRLLYVLFSGIGKGKIDREKKQLHQCLLIKYIYFIIGQLKVLHIDSCRKNKMAGISHSVLTDLLKLVLWLISVYMLS